MDLKDMQEILKKKTKKNKTKKNKKKTVSCLLAVQKFQLFNGSEKGCLR